MVITIQIWLWINKIPKRFLWDAYSSSQRPDWRSLGIILLRCTGGFKGVLGGERCFRGSWGQVCGVLREWCRGFPASRTKFQFPCRSSMQHLERSSDPLLGTVIRTRFPLKKDMFKRVIATLVNWRIPASEGHVVVVRLLQDGNGKEAREETEGKSGSVHRGI